ncbi:unnamed protein product [Pseudo-nitzschia multistriata]|uniref:Uncharacterized protein n=1 Tax=Pseudo-nitzschia multistriata TaxID=183589 RepID=A0A448ZKR8_9STRA|nr:unnamed protein product [Pseudo-nitzschia multistriata]
MPQKPPTTLLVRIQKDQLQKGHQLRRRNNWTTRSEKSAMQEKRREVFASPNRLMSSEPFYPVAVLSYRRVRRVLS